MLLATRVTSVVPAGKNGDAAAHVMVMRRVATTICGRNRRTSLIVAATG